MKKSLGKMLGVGLCLWAIGLYAQPVITNQPVNQAVVWGGNATFSVLATGTGLFTYQWQLNGTNLPNNIITTVAGGNLFNNLPATNTIFNSLQGAAVDSVGNIFVADSWNNVVRKIDTNGMMTIIAGTGSASFSGDGGSATNAGLWLPAAVVLDTNHNLFISDSGNNRIRKVDTNGIITTIAGSSGLALGDNGQATNASLWLPTGLACDGSGNLYIADTDGQRIREVNTSGIITTVAGNGNPGPSGGGLSRPATSVSLNTPYGVAVDLAGNLYVADTYNYQIRKVSGGYISAFAGTGAIGNSGDGGSAKSATMGVVFGLTVDTKGNVFIADTGNNRIRKITNNIITTVVGTGTAGFSGDGASPTSANLAAPYNVSVDSVGNLFVVDYGNNRIRKAGTNGVIVTVAGCNMNDGALATNATLNGPWGVTQDGLGNFYISDTASSRIYKLDTHGLISNFAGNGVPTFAGDGGLATNASLAYQYGIVADGIGNVFIADRGNYRVRRVNTNGIITTVAGKGVSQFSGDGGAATNAGLLPLGVAVDNLGNLFIADVNSRIRKVDTNGNIATVAGNGSYSFSGDGGMATNAGILSPNAVAVDSVGNLFVSDGNARIRKVDSLGFITTVAGNGTNGYSGDGGQATNAEIYKPYGLAVDASGNLLLADTFNHRIRKVATNGIITTVGGDGVQGFSGDGGQAGIANLSTPDAICFDSRGNLFIADLGNNRIRELSYLEYADQPTFTLTNVTPASMSNNYSVIITSASGSVTSSPVSVSVQLPPITPAYTASNGLYSFTWSAVVGQAYQLQYATNLPAPVWTDLGCWARGLRWPGAGFAW